MYRKAMAELSAWKKSPYRRPLIVRGARQVGKTYLLKAFGALEYQQVIYLDFEEDRLLAEAFAHSLKPQDIISYLEIVKHCRITPENTLLIFDEVQSAPRALTSLKYFAEQAPDYHLACAGSLLGIAMHEGTSFPVGKVDFLDLYPLSFLEFLMARGEERLTELIKAQNFTLLNALAPRLEEYKGALTEQFVLNELKSLKLEVFYWSAENAKAEIDFLIAGPAGLMPIEVKAAVNLKAKSLKVFREKFAPAFSLRCSLAPYEVQPGLINLPLWALEGFHFADADLPALSASEAKASSAPRSLP